MAHHTVTALMFINAHSSDPAFIYSAEDYDRYDALKTLVLSHRRISVPGRRFEVYRIETARTMSPAVQELAAGSLQLAAAELGTCVEAQVHCEPRTIHPCLRTKN